MSSRTESPAARAAVAGAAVCVVVIAGTFIFREAREFFSDDVGERPRKGSAGRGGSLPHGASALPPQGDPSAAADPAADPSHDPSAGSATRASVGAGVLYLDGRHTPESFAEAVADPESFRYDPAKRTATCRKSLIIRGRLVLGEPDQPDKGQALEMDTRVCGDLNVRVETGAELLLYHSTLTTSSKTVAGGQCPQGYTLAVRGRLVLDNSVLDYMSGSYSDLLLPGSRAEVHKSHITHGDGTCLKVVSPKETRAAIEDSTLGVMGGWAMLVSGDADPARPLVVRGCTLKSQAGPVNNGTPAGRVELVDCRVSVVGERPRSYTMGFGGAGPDARTAVRWTIAVTAVRQGADGSATPVPGLRIVAEPAEAATRPAAAKLAGPPVSAVTDADGAARLVLTEWVAEPKHPRPDDSNRVGPYRIRAYAAAPSSDGKAAPDGKAAGAVLAEGTVQVRGLGERVRLVIP